MKKTKDFKEMKLKKNKGEEFPKREKIKIIK